MVPMLLAIAAVSAPSVDCHFDQVRLEFVGTPSSQARCLLRPVKAGGAAGPDADLPTALAVLIGQPCELDRGKLSAELEREHIPLPVNTPVSETSDHRRALYFVIHDTSSPWIGVAAFPQDFGKEARFNDVRQFLGPNAVAHLFNDRSGKVTVGHDLEVGWRATKLEKAVGESARGRFIHVENVQPRREDVRGPPHNDLVAPQPGFTAAQYRTLALLYALASSRAGTWLIPAFHANIDRGIADAHDDPQNFDLPAFDHALEQWIAVLR